jgi:phage terminase large subunit-like protein
MAPALPKHIAQAIKSGPIPVTRDFRKLSIKNLTKAEKVILFAERHLRVPDGLKAGEPIHVELFQEIWLRAVLDNPHGTRDAVMSIARRNGKTFLVSLIVLAALVGPLAEDNIVVASAANSRDQAALIFKMMDQMIKKAPTIQPLVHVIPSAKEIRGLSKGTTYYAMSAETKTGHGRSLKYIILDESGQINGPTSEYVEMLRTSQGSYENPLFATISTQAAADGDYLSIMIDDAERSNDPHTVCHVYSSPKELPLLSEEGMLASNPGLDVFRSRADLISQLEKAERLPTLQAGAENLLLNRRVAQEALFLSPAVWRRNSAMPDLEVFQKNTVAVGLDLSGRNDLTAAVLAAADDKGDVHLRPYTFTPSRGIRERAQRDRTPYELWVDQGFLVPIGGESIDYNQVAEYLRDEF